MLVFLIIVNYLVKILTIIIGIVLLTGLFMPDKLAAEPMMKVLGAVLIVWGVYRTVVYRIQLRRYKSYENDDE